MIRDFIQDVRFGLRTLGRSPGSTVMVVLSLALGISANAAIFSVLDALMLKPLPVPDAAALTFLTDGRGSGRSSGGGPPVRDGRVTAYSYPLYQQLRANSRGFHGLAAEDSMGASATVQRSGSAPVDEELAGHGVPVSANYFQVLGVGALRGRTFLPEDETAAGANPVLVLSHGYWQRRFGGDPSVLGGRLVVNGHQYTVVGITPPGFVGTKVGEATDFWVPITMHAQLVREEPLLAKPGEYWLLVIGRLAPGATAASAQASADLTLQRWLVGIQDQMPLKVRELIARQGFRIELEPGAMGFSSLRRSFRDPLLALMAGVALLLLIVCLNVSHLLLARAIQRQREMSIRTALGAGRARLLRQLLTESLLLSFAGAGAAILATRWLTDGLLSLAVGEGSRRALAVGIDGRVLGFTALLAVAVALLLGVVPAWQATRTDLAQSLRGTSQSIAGSGSRRLVSRLLLASQVAFSLVLLVGAGLLSGSLRKIKDVDRGFDEQHLLLAGINVRTIEIGKERRVPFFNDLLQRVSAIPGVRSASVSFTELLNRGRWTSTISFAGAKASVDPSPHIFVVSPSYFATVGMTLARGRDLGARDGQGAPKVAVINETMASRAFGDGNAIGQRFRFGDVASEAPTDVEVVGIVKDAKTNSLREQPRPTVYVPLAQHDPPLDAVQVRAAGDPALLAEQVRRTLRQIHPELRVTGVRTMTQAVDRSLRQERLLATLSSAFGLVALFLVCVGLYGVISQWASQRTREIGVRMALGATSGGVRWLVLRQAFVLIALGLVVGLPAAVGATRLLEGMLFGLRAMDPATLSLAACALLAVATAAAYLPARRASRVDPMRALRTE